MRFPAVVPALVLLLACSDASRAAPDPPGDGPLRLVRTIELSGVEGRIDHLTRDAARGRLFVAALGNGSVEVVSLATGERTSSLRGLPEPQGVVHVPGADALAVACGGDGSVRLFAGETLAKGAVVELSGDADNLRWCAATKRVWAAFGAGGLASIDPAKPGDAPLVVPLDAHPEGFQVEASGTRAFVNLAARGEVAVCDLAARKVTARWKLGGASANYPMALDEAAQRVYVGCRSPARLVALATDDGRVTASVECAGDPDDVFVDAAAKRAYVVCGAGEVDVFSLEGAEPALMAKVPTAKGARTALLDGGRLYVAAPARSGKPAAVLEFEVR